MSRKAKPADGSKPATGSRVERATSNYDKFTTNQPHFQALASQALTFAQAAKERGDYMAEVNHNLMYFHLWPYAFCEMMLTRIEEKHD